MLREYAIPGALAACLLMVCSGVNAAPAPSPGAAADRPFGVAKEPVSSHRYRPHHAFAHYKVRRVAAFHSPWQPPIPDGQHPAVADQPIAPATEILLPSPEPSTPRSRGGHRPRFPTTEVALAPPLASRDQSAVWRRKYDVLPVLPNSLQPTPLAIIALTPQEQMVSEFAARRGDSRYLMVDKAHGKIILFEQGQPVFTGPALTGESLTDTLPDGAQKEKFAQMSALYTKVTPAGRFTVTRHADPNYGTVFDVNEIRGKDWGIAIHKVYLGTPSEHRNERIQSPSEEDKHITFGCINVTPAFLQLLLRELPDHSVTPVYILPVDESRTAEYFSSNGF